jgi:hypothetical protein
LNCKERSSEEFHPKPSQRAADAARRTTMLEQPFAIPALALFILAIPLVFRVVPRNRFYGVRTRQTLSNDQAWKRTNRVAGIVIMFASVVYGAIALAYPYDRRASSNFLNSSASSFL